MFCYTASDRTASPDPVVDKQAVFDQLDVTNPEHADFYLPMFGDSPGGTPSVSSAGSVADSRSDLDDISDVSFYVKSVLEEMLVYIRILLFA